MGDMQAKIMRKLRATAEAAGLEFSDQPNYHNTGTVFVQTSEFATVVEVGYDFQVSYMNVKLRGEGVAKSPAALADKGAKPGSKIAEVNMMLNYGTQADMIRLFDVFTAILADNGYRNDLRVADGTNQHGPKA